MPNSELMAAGEMPQLHGQTCNDMTRWAIELQQWGSACEARQGGLRLFFDRVQGTVK